jgi:hypothetical protein
MQDHPRRYTGITIDPDVTVLVAVIISIVYILIILLMGLTDIRIWYYDLASVVRELDIRHKVYESNTGLNQHRFYKEYSRLRPYSIDHEAVTEIRERHRRGR